MIRLAITSAFLVSLACGNGGPEGPIDPPPSTTPPPVELTVAVVASGLSAPLLLTAPPGDPRLFVVEQGGRIRIINGGTLQPTPFLDLSDRVSNGGERGLLGLAFHPGFGRNGVIVVNYTDREGDTRVSTFRAGADPAVADPGSEQVVLSIAQPFGNHNGGHLAFGPDGMLYVGTGDGGSANDPQQNGQNPNRLLGKLLRVAIHDDGGMSVPADNPFSGQAGKRAEIWASGLRNPWRFAFDREDGSLWIGDVGQGAREEVDHVASARGLNFGWQEWEGNRCTRGSCSREGFTFPVHEYGHDDGCSITGGYPYRGKALGEALAGWYFFADYCGGWVRSIAPGGAITEWPTLGGHGQITSFGEDAEGELYIVVQGGTVYRIVKQ